jgi:hypothetical protein
MQPHHPPWNTLYLPLLRFYSIFYNASWILGLIHKEMILKLQNLYQDPFSSPMPPTWKSRKQCKIKAIMQCALECLTLFLKEWYFYWNVWSVMWEFLFSTVLIFIWWFFMTSGNSLKQKKKTTLIISVWNEAFIWFVLSGWSIVFLKIV